MKVSELIEELKKYDGDLDVAVLNCYEGDYDYKCRCNIEEIRLDKDFPSFITCGKDGIPAILIS